MVLLDSAFPLLRQLSRTVSRGSLPKFPTPKAAWRAGILDLLPLMVLNRKNSRRRPGRRVPAPGWKKTYQSVLLGRRLHLRVTRGTQRAIKIAGGFDRYIYYTPEAEFKSVLAVSLKRRMDALVAKHPSIEPPPLDKRNPKPLPKKLSVAIKPVEVCSMSKYVYLG